MGDSLGFATKGLPAEEAIKGITTQLALQAKNEGGTNLMPGAMDGLTFLRKHLTVPTQILSSTANEARYEDISNQKLIWLQTHGITFSANFVPGKRHKYKFSGPDKIIIDDS